MLVRQTWSRSLTFGLQLAPPVLDCIYVVAAFFVWLVLVAVLGALGFGVGFDVSPIGEDYNWIDMLQRGRGAEAARLLWAIDHRNPLSPWWYIAARSIILGFDAGLLALRYLISVVLAISAYALVLTIAGQRARAFGLGLAMVIVVWTANRYTDQIIWNFEGALAASLLSVAAYARFLMQGRRSYRLYAASVVLWFIAFGTYTVQCGAVLAIVYLALRHAPTRNRSIVRQTNERVLNAGLDATPHLVVFLLFILVWQTTMGPFAPAISFNFSTPALLRSLQEGLLSGDLAIFYDRFVASPDRVAFVAGAAVCGGVGFLLLQRRERGCSEIAPVISHGGLVDVLVTVACIAAPTILLESTSAVWGPGTRWPMINQLTTPALFLAVLALLVLRAPGGSNKQLWSVGVAAAIGTGALFSLAHNYRQNEFTRYERFVRDSIWRLVAEDSLVGRKPPTQVLLMLEPPNRFWWRSSDILSPTIARVWLGRDDVSFRLLPWSSSDSPSWAPWWRVRFGPDGDGVGNAKVWGGTVPYEQLRILDVQGRSARRVTRADRADFAGWEVEWDRSGPISLAAIDPGKLCPMRWSADQDAILNGWSEGERDDRGPVRWTSSRSARLTFPASCSGRAVLRVIVAYGVSMRPIESLRLSVNGQRVAYRRERTGGNFVYEAELDARVLSDRPILRLDLEVDVLDTVAGAARQFGVAVRGVEILSAPLQPQ
jgi:hypothetical protein